MTDLTIVEPNNLPTLFADSDKMEAAIVSIEKVVLAEVPDLSSKKGRAAVTSLAYKVSQTKGPVTKCADEMKADAQAVIKAVNATKASFTARMDDLRDTVKAPLIEWQKIEADRVDALEALLSEKFAFEIDTTSAGIEVQIENLKSVSVDQDVWAEFAGAAQVAKKQMLEKLREISSSVKQREEADALAEANRIELEELRAQQAEAAAARQKLADEEAADREVEADRLKAERARELEELRAQQAEERAENEAARAAAEAKIAELREEAEAKDAAAAKADMEAKRIAADKKRKASSAKAKSTARTAAITALYKADMTEDMATAAVDLIIEGGVPHIIFSTIL